MQDSVDAKNFVYGAKIAIMDFSPEYLEYFRRIGKIVAIPDQPGVLETALALSGSAAQSKIQKNPGDADFFQRVNIKAPTRAAAIQILADAMRAKALATLRGADYLAHVGMNLMVVERCKLQSPERRAMRNGSVEQVALTALKPTMAH
jgi:hypothetical protein